MVLRAQRELQAREVLWGFQVCEVNEECQVSQGQRSVSFLAVTLPCIDLTHRNCPLHSTFFVRALFAFRDHQENRDLLDQLETKGPQGQLVFQVPMDHVAIPVLMLVLFKSASVLAIVFHAERLSSA